MVLSVDPIVLDDEPLFFDEHAPVLLPIAHQQEDDNPFDWIPVMGEEMEDDMHHLDPIAAFAQSLDHESIALADRHWGKGHDAPFEVEDLDRILSSGSSSPTNESPSASSPSEDGSEDEEDEDEEEEEDLPNRKTLSKRIIKAKRANYTDDDNDNDFKLKKTKAKKGSVTKPINKQIRRIQDEATMRLINQLRSEAPDHPESRRRIHNVLERKRRNDLKFCYQELRESIPDLEATDRTPTGTILARAADFIRSLQEEEKKIDANLAAARQENEMLRRQLGLN